MPPGSAKSHWQLFLVFEMVWIRLNVFGKTLGLNGKNLGCEGPPVPVNQLHTMALQVWRVWGWLVWDVNFWNPMALTLKLISCPCSGWGLFHAANVSTP